VNASIFAIHPIILFNPHSPSEKITRELERQRIPARAVFSYRGSFVISRLQRRS